VHQIKSVAHKKQNGGDHNAPRVARSGVAEEYSPQDFTISLYYELDSFLRASLTQSPELSAKQYNRISHHGDSFASQTRRNEAALLAKRVIDRELSACDCKSEQTYSPVVRTDTDYLARDRINGNNSTSSNDASINGIYRG
jgi:hypothetical protein